MPRCWPGAAGGQSVQVAYCWTSGGEFPQLAYRAIAAAVGVHHQTVERIRNSQATGEIIHPTKRVGIDGPFQPLVPSIKRRPAFIRDRRAWNRPDISGWSRARPGMARMPHPMLASLGGTIATMSRARADGGGGFVAGFSLCFRHDCRKQDAALAATLPLLRQLGFVLLGAGQSYTSIHARLVPCSCAVRCTRLSASPSKNFSPNRRVTVMLSGSAVTS